MACVKISVTYCEVTDPSLKKAVFSITSRAWKKMKITGPHEGPSAPALQWFTTRPQSLVLTELIFFYACMFRIPLV